MGPPATRGEGLWLGIRAGLSIFKGILVFVFGNPFRSHTLWIQCQVTQVAQRTFIQWNLRKSVMLDGNYSSRPMDNGYLINSLIIILYDFREYFSYAEWRLVFGTNINYIYLSLYKYLPSNIRRMVTFDCDCDTLNSLPTEYKKQQKTIVAITILRK